MSKKIAVIGASLGGLIAAAELSENGFSVTIIEKGKSVGGLYNKIQTPFGTQELGMHVLYASEDHYKHLTNIFGSEVFHVLRGCDVDVGACVNFDSTFFNSHYPNVIGHASENDILLQIIEAKGKGKTATNAMEEVVNRFGDIGGREVVGPILEKLWHLAPELLTKNSLHCYFDLRRIIACDKKRADELKKDKWLDDIIGNPLQDQPFGQVHGGRIGITFKNSHSKLGNKVTAWAQRVGVSLNFEQDVALVNGRLQVNGRNIHQDYDGCIIALPMHSLAGNLTDKADQLDLSIYYFQLAEKIEDQFPSYYVLCHSNNFKSSRIVNFDAYNQENTNNRPSVLAVEVIHEIGQAPDLNDIADEVTRVIPGIRITEGYQLERSVKVYSPSLANARLFDAVRQQIEQAFSNTPVYFTGMRTDTGVFFSHHTIGLAYESALECSRKLS